MDRFLANGSQIYDAALRQDYKAKVRALKARLRSAGSVEERQLIADALNELKADFRAKAGKIGGCLF